VVHAVGIHTRVRFVCRQPRLNNTTLPHFWFLVFGATISLVMKHPMRNILKIAGVFAGLGAAAWALRDQLLPQPETAVGEIPKFRAPATGDDLTLIKGVGPVYRDRLAEAGILSFSELASATPEQIAETAGTSSSVAAGWVKSARSMA